MVKKITLNDLATMMKEGFDEIHEKFATKDDLKAFATKDDFKLIKEQIAELTVTTKEGFDEIQEKFATKDELNKRFDETLTKEDATISLIKQVKEEIACIIWSQTPTSR